MIKVTTFYKFIAIDSEALTRLQAWLTAKASELGIRGLLLIGREGCNATISGEEKKLSHFKEFLESLPEIGKLEFKDSRAPSHPFRRFKVDIREEIVTLKDPNALPSGKNNHLSPSEWQKVLESEDDFVLIDTRNFYETEIGKFKKALDLKLSKFSEFPERVKELGLSKEKKILMYCTGGIRCEKAILDMQAQGFKNVFQLDGGILKYLEDFPNREFEGECFVFDHRVAVDQKLEPSARYKLCPHCGNPADKNINCVLCEKPAVVCKHCLQKSPSLYSCSKNCAYHAGVRGLAPKAVA